MSEITQLDEATISKIAAGEVVERPASVVKELLENSLDAGARRVDVSVAAGGTDLVRVSDDGRGMTETDARRAVEKHTTSKIASIEDLEAGVGTLGFRGEALHTIGAVSRLTIQTRSRAGDAAGTELRVEGGELTDVAPVGRAPGTTVTVEDLFFNTPARRKFLSREETEFAHINRVVSRYSLANPGVAVALEHDGREVFATPGSEDLEAAVLAVYGRDVAQSMRPVEAQPDGPIESVSGLVSDPETTRSSREYVSTFVNSRYVKSSRLRSAVRSAYGKQLAADRYPFAVLFVSVPPETVDVNVHPRKTAVRFDDTAAVADAVEGAVRGALLEAGLLRSGAPRGRSAPEEARIRPGESEVVEPGEAERRPGSRNTASDGPSADASDSRAGQSDSTRPAPPDLEPGKETGGVDSGTEPEADLPLGDDAGFRPQGGESDGHRPARIDREPAQTDLSGEAEAIDRPSTGRLPDLRVLGQIEDTYVVASSPDGLVLIDQHAADERVNYERLQARLAETPPSQRLLEPVNVSLTPGEARRFEAIAEELTLLGFDATLEGEVLRVRSVPAVVDTTVEPATLRDLLDTALEGEPAGPLDSIRDAVLADMACYPSITGNTSLSEGSILELLEALDDCENPYACPHGRPTIIEISAEEIENRFERDYPGGGH